MILPAALLIGLVALIFWMRARRRRRNRDFNEQLGETLTMIAGSLRGEFSLVQSLANAAKESQEPTRSELRRVLQEIQLGLSLNQALDHPVKRVESDDLDLVVTAIKIHARVGGNLTTILENISTTIRERAKLNYFSLLMLGVLGICGFFLPDVWLSRRIKQRQQSLVNALPDALDMLTIAIEAGLSFENAMQEISTKGLSKN